jgi:hypothetical protein
MAGAGQGRQSTKNCAMLVDLKTLGQLMVAEVHRANGMDGRAPLMTW